MTEFEVERAGVSRRSVLLGMGVVAGAAAAVSALPARAIAAPTAVDASMSAVPEALSSPTPGLTYIGLDAQAFLPSQPEHRVGGDIDLTGTKGFNGERIWANLPLPAGSIVHQMNVGYIGQPIAEISKRAITQPSPAQIPIQVFQQSLPAGGGPPASATLNFDTPVVIDRESTYTVSFFIPSMGGAAVFGCSIGYLPPTQSFVPFTGTDPRVLDTRQPGPLNGKLGPNQEKVVPLGFAGARSAVLNLTVTETIGAGFVAVFPAGIAWPGNSSINWSASNQNIANGVISAVDGNGAIKIRGGSNPTHVVIDRIGFMV
jgi:hypothetical protein